MTKFKIIYGGDEYDEEFSTYDDAEECATYLSGCERQGAEIMHMSNPGDYDYDEENWESSDYEIIEIED